MILPRRPVLAALALFASLSGGTPLTPLSPHHNGHYDLDACQHPTPSPLSGCPPNTLLVGPSSTANFTTIQSAITSLGNASTPAHILVLPGTYRESLNITSRAPLYILGQTSSPRSQPSNTVSITCALANNDTTNLPDNADTSCLTIAPNYNASLVGAGPTGFATPPYPETPFGNVDFRLYNIDVRNLAGEYSIGPAMALGMGFANAGFYYSGFYSYQDTIYVGKLGNAYFYGCEIAGQTDYLYGFGSAWFENTKLTMRGCGGGVIAWKGTNTTFHNKYGCYVSHSELVPANETIGEVDEGACYLGRPWNGLHRSIFMDTYMSAMVSAEGYTLGGWDANFVPNVTMMAEYRSYGPGWDAQGRADSGGVSEVLGPERVAPYRRPVDVFMDPMVLESENRTRQPYVGWIDERYLVE